MKLPIEASYTLTVADFEVLTHAYRRLTFGRRAARLVYYGALVCMACAVLISLWIRDWELAMFSLAVLAVMLFVEHVINPWRVRRRFAHQRLGEYEIAISADEEGFSTRSALADGRHRWEAIRRVDDLPGHVLLWANDNFGWLVPKRAFATVNESEAFARLAKEKTAGQTL